MLKNIDLKNAAILIDFDGTITTEDTNDKLVRVFWNDKVEEFYKNNDEKDMTYVDFMDTLFSKLKISEEEYLNFILNDIEISPGFIEFYKRAKQLNIPISIISGGFINGIVPFLDKHGINDIEILANKLNFNGENITVDFYHNRDKDCCSIGYCGNCKRKHVKEFKKDHQEIIFIGDGITDEPVASKADLVFAKDGLLEYCNNNNICCIAWKDFFDIERILFKAVI